MFRNFTRIFIMGTSVWFVGTQLTFKIGDITGHCLDANLSRVAGVLSRRSCRALAGENTWSAFDISGHTFLLTWCLYLTSVEFKLFNTFRFKTHPFLIELIAFLLAGWIAVLNLLWLIMLGKWKICNWQYELRWNMFKIFEASTFVCMFH